MVLAGHTRFWRFDMEKIEFNGTTIDAEVVERDANGVPQRIRYEGAELVRAPTKREPNRWLMQVGLSPLKAARDLLQADYDSDVKGISEDVRQRVKSGELDTKNRIVEFVHESCDSSYRTLDTGARHETLVYTANRDRAEDGTDLGHSAFLAFEADVYDDLGDIDDLLAEHAETENGDDDEYPT